MRFLCLIVAMLTFFGQSSEAQITITRSDWESVFGHGGIELAYTDTTLRGQSGAFPADVGSSGGPHVYDFSTRPFASPDTAIDFSVSLVPFLAARYPADALGVRVPGSLAGSYEYVLFRFADSGFMEIGHAATYPDNRQLFRHYDPELVAHPFPTTLGLSWSYTTTARETTYVGGSPTLISTDDWNQNRSIDGYGTLKLPGRDVALLVDGYLSAGEHGVDWKATGLASGVYVYRLQAGDLVATRKLTVLK